MAQRDSARQEESYGCGLQVKGVVWHHFVTKWRGFNILTPEQEGFIRGRGRSSLMGGPGGFRGMRSGTLFPTPPPVLHTLTYGVCAQHSCCECNHECEL